MYDFRLQATPAVLKAPLHKAGLTLKPHETGSIVTLAFTRTNLDAADEEMMRHFGVALPAIGQSVHLAQGGIILRPASERAYVVGSDVLREVTTEAGALHVIDQSDYWAVISLEGAGIVGALERLWKLDLSDSTFPEGAVARSTLGHLACMLYRASHTSYQVFIPRSFAKSAYDELAETLHWL